MVFWALLMTGVLTLPLVHPPLLWHRHEMIFGFLNPAIAGFLLTAVCVWTGTERLHGTPLVLLWLVWLAGRLTGARIVRARQWRQLVVLVVIALLWLMQLGMLTTGTAVFTDGALIAAAALMLVIGGRITPTFSANWLRAQGENPAQVRTLPALEAALLASLVLLLGSVLARHGGAVTATALAAAVLALVRLGLWRGWRVRRGTS